MPWFQIFVGIPASTAFAFLGRWLQLHPERMIWKELCAGPNTWAARLFKFQVIFVGSFALFFGTFGAIFFMLLSMFTFDSEFLKLLLLVLATLGGIAALILVRREVRARPPYISSGGRWP
jgi:hypothetical protein